MALVSRKLFVPCTPWGPLDLGVLRLLLLALQQGLCCVLGNITYMKGKWNGSVRLVTGL